MDTRFESVLAKLERVKRSGKGWSARCPAHEDNRASLRVWIADKGDLRLKCFAGCGFAEIIAAIGVGKFECNAERRTRRMAREVASYDYKDESGRLLFQVVRFEPKDFRQRVPDGSGWKWGLNGAKRVLYRLPELVKSPDRHVLVVEGEKDADRLAKEGFLATCNPMGAGKWEPNYTATLAGRKVVLIPDNDKAGEEHVANVAKLLHPVSTVCIARVSGAKDISDWFNAGHKAAELKEICKQALKTAEVLAQLRALDRKAKWLAARQLMDDLANADSAATLLPTSKENVTA